MKPFFIVAAILLSSGASASYPGLELRCHGFEGDYQVKFLSESYPGMLLEEEPRLRAFVRNNADMSVDVLEYGEYLVQKTHKQWVFANLKEHELLTCVEQENNTVFLSGVLERTAGIGDESSGVGLRITHKGQADRLIEVAGKDDGTLEQLRSLIGARALVSGYYITTVGAETGDYSVFVVEKAAELILNSQSSADSFAVE